jgi:hypothetical protein
LSRGLNRYADIPLQEAESKLESESFATPAASSSSTGGTGEPRRRNRERERALEEVAQLRAVMEIQDRSLFWVIGTSLIFEAVMLTVAGVVFCRRDF